MAEPYLRNVQFLVVDDSPFSRQFFHGVLYALGARTIILAKDAKEAATLVREVKPDIAIVDWEMEPTNGLEFTRTIRTAKDSPNPFLPIIMVSAHATPQRVAMARDSGVTEYLIMPVSAKALFGRIQAVIERPRPFIRVGKYFGPERRRRKGKEDLGFEERRDAAAGKARKAAAEQAMQQEDVDSFFNPEGGAAAKADRKTGSITDRKK